jgi:hypothetical protein
MDCFHFHDRVAGKKACPRSPEPREQLGDLDRAVLVRVGEAKSHLLNGCGKPILGAAPGAPPQQICRVGRPILVEQRSGQAQQAGRPEPGLGLVRRNGFQLVKRFRRLSPLLARGVPVGAGGRLSPFHPSVIRPLTPQNVQGLVQSRAFR